MKLSNGYILGTLGKIASDLKDKFKESAIWGFWCGDSAVNDAISESMIPNTPEYIKGKLAQKKKKTKEKTLAGRKPLARAQERVGAVDAAALKKGFGYVFGGAVRNSKIIALLDRIWGMICNMQASLVGALMLLTSISSFAVSLIKHIIKVATQADTLSLFISILTFIIAVFLVSTGTKSIYELFTQSMFGFEFMNNVMGIRIVEEKKTESSERAPTSSPKTFVVILFCLIICVVSLFAGLERIIVSFLVLALIVAILKMPESGIIMLLLSFPWFASFENGVLILSGISVLVLISWIFKIAVGKRVYSFGFVDASVAVFLIVYLFGGIFGNTASWDIGAALCNFAIATLYFPVSGLIRSSEWINRSMRAYTTGTMIVSFVGITQFVLRSVGTGTFVFGITSAFNNNQSLCAYLLVGIFIGIFNLQEKDEGRLNISYAISLAMNLACFVLAGSKTAYLAFVIALLVYLLIQKPKIVALGAFLTPFLASAWIMMPSVIKNTVTLLLESTDIELKSKIYIWRSVISSAKDHLLFGIGTSDLSVQTVLADICDVLPSSLQFYNLYISIVVKLGIVGFIVFAVFSVSALQRGFFVVSKSVKESYFKNLSATSTTALVSLLVFGMGSSLLHDECILMLFFFAVAMLRCTKEVYIRETWSDDDLELLDIDLSVQRKVEKESKILVFIVQMLAKAVKKSRKKRANVSKQINAEFDDEDSPEESDDVLDAVVIEEVDLCEEESTWQRK